MKKLATGRLAHILGVLGFVLSLASISWQVYVYRESLTEHAIVKLTALRISKDASEATATATAYPKGGLWAEVVNTGQHPIYLRVVWIDRCDQVMGRAIFYGGLHKPEASLKLEPGESKTFKEGWDFVAQPLTQEPSPDYCVNVLTTKGQIVKEAARISVEMFADEKRQSR